MDLGFPTQAGGRRAPEVVRYTGRKTRGHSFSDEAAGPFRSSPQAPHPSPRGGTVPVTHPSRGRDERSVSEVQGAGISGWTRGKSHSGNGSDERNSPSSSRRPRALSFERRLSHVRAHDDPEYGGSRSARVEKHRHRTDCAAVCRRSLARGGPWPPHDRHGNSAFRSGRDPRRSAIPSRSKTWRPRNAAPNRD